MSLNFADKDFIRAAVQEEIRKANQKLYGHMESVNSQLINQVARVVPRGLVHTVIMATTGFILATALMELKNQNIKHLSYPLAEAERVLVDTAGLIAVWSGGYLADYNRMYPTQIPAQMIIGLTNNQTVSFMAAMRQRESSNDYGRIHQYGYLGAYGIGAWALADIGYIDVDALNRAPSAVKYGTSRAQQLAFLQDDNNWKRYSYHEFMTKNAVQDQAFLDLANLNIRRGFKRGALKRGDHKRLAGFAAAAHLVGMGAAIQYYGANIDSDDRYGTRASEYAKLGENAIKGPAPLDTGLRPDGLPMDKGLYTRTSSGFGYRTLNGVRAHHEGIDFPVPVGTPVKATADGKVVYAGNYGGSCGYGVKIQHSNDIATVFCHLSRVDARRNEWIRKGAVLGLSGGAQGAPGSGKSTGPHIHYSVKINDRAVDPLLYIPQLAGGKTFNDFAIRPQQVMQP